MVINSLIIAVSIWLFCGMVMVFRFIINMPFVPAWWYIPLIIGIYLLQGPIALARFPLDWWRGYV